MKQTFILASTVLFMAVACTSQTAPKTVPVADTNEIGGENIAKTKRKIILPEAVDYKFKNEHPEAKKPEWDEESDNYTVKFIENGFPCEIVYNGRSYIVDKHIGFSPEKLNARIKKHLADKYPQQKAVAAYNNYGNKISSIRVDLESKKQVFYDLSGTFVREESEN
jgi:hypothetical protein